MHANAKKQKYIIESLLASPDVFARCVGILKPDYFDKNYEMVMDFVMEYYNTHNGVPKIRQIEVEFDEKLKDINVTTDEVDYVCSEIEKFCKETALVRAIKDSLVDIEEGNHNAISERVTDALTITLDRDLGIDFFKDVKERLESHVLQNTHEPTQIEALDKHLGGGLIRRQLTLFSANSGGGKSIMMNNIGLNFAYAGKHVVYISLELPEDMIDIRSAAIWSDVDISDWKTNIPYLSARIEQGAERGGSFDIKRMPQGCCVNDIKSYLKQYEIKNGFTPDMLAIDYIDLMSPNGGSKGMGVSDKDKYVTEQVTELLHQYNLYGISASQQNRDGIGNSAPDQSIIAGGLTKINTTDNYISLYMDPAMRQIGKMMMFFLKTRSSDGVGKSEEISFNSKTLTITDVDSRTPFSVMPKPKIKKSVNTNDEEKSNLDLKLGREITSLPDKKSIIKDSNNDGSDSQFERFVDEVNEEQDKIEEMAKKVLDKPKPKKDFSMDDLSSGGELSKLMTSINEGE